ncbi:MAG: hypothetical protein IT343_11455 [Candidatus Melainabacteria bacterium]|jgi:hypothetical protein|nr:hypothetical protein [Candidatus Melainabacteria bacterium]
MNDLKTQNKHTARHQYLVAIDGALALTAVLLIVQMWLLTASLETHLGGDKDSAVPGAIFSFLLFSGNFGLYCFVSKLEKKARKKGL